VRIVIYLQFYVVSTYSRKGQSTYYIIGGVYAVFGLSKFVSLDNALLGLEFIVIVIGTIYKQVISQIIFTMKEQAANI